MKYVNQTNQESYERMNVMNKMKTRIGVVSMATLAMSGSVAGSAIAAISKSFPDTPISTIQLLSTLPGVGSLIITLVAGQMAMRFEEKPGPAGGRTCHIGRPCSGILEQLGCRTSGMFGYLGNGRRLHFNA